MFFRGRILTYLLIYLICSCVFSSSVKAETQSFDYNKYRGNVDLQNIFADYMTDLRASIQKNWIPPDYLEKNAHALVKFSITRRGDVYSAEIVESSGDKIFDESTLEAIRKSSPFPKFPPSTAKSTLTISYSFDTSISNINDMQKYLDEANKYYNIDNEKSLVYINKAIDEVNGDYKSYFLYGKRGQIKSALGDYKGAEEDIQKAKYLKSRFDQKRIIASKLVAEMEKTPFAYYSLAHSYDIAGEIDNAIISIDKAIELTDLNNNYKRYKEELIQKQSVKNKRN